jgi:hypothetical protein
MDNHYCNAQAGIATLRGWNLGQLISCNSELAGLDAGSRLRCSS